MGNSGHDLFSNGGLSLFAGFGKIFEAKIDDFPCYFLASFFYRFFKASGGILGGILTDFGR